MKIIYLRNKPIFEGKKSKFRSTMSFSKSQHSSQKSYESINISEKDNADINENQVCHTQVQNLFYGSTIDKKLF